MARTRSTTSSYVQQVRHVALVQNDVLLLSIGFDVSFRYPFPIIGRNGLNLRDKWDPLPNSYLSVCTDGFPNCFFSCGPNSAIGTSSLLTMIEHQVDYAISVARKLQRERLKSIEVKPEAVADFEEVVGVSVPLLTKYNKA